MLNVMKARVQRAASGGDTVGHNPAARTPSFVPPASVTRPGHPISYMGGVVSTPGMMVNVGGASQSRPISPVTPAELMAPNNGAAPFVCPATPLNKGTADSFPAPPAHPPSHHRAHTSHFITFAFFATLKFHLFQFSILERKALSIPCVGHLGLTGRVVAMRGRRYGHGRVSSGGPPRFAGPDDGFSAAVASDNDNTKR